MTEIIPTHSEVKEAGHDAISFGSRIRKKREEAGLTPARLSLRAGIPKPVLQKVEEGDASQPFAFFLAPVWRLDNFSTCCGILRPEGLKARGRSPIDQMMALVGKRIQGLCDEESLSQQEVARRTGLDVPTVARIVWGTPWVAYRDYEKVFVLLGHGGDLAAVLA